MFDQDLEMKECVKSSTLYTARKTWEVRIHMLDVVGNYPGQRKYEESKWMCRGCNLNVKEVDLGNEKELVEFFTRLVERRKQQKWN